MNRNLNCLIITNQMTEFTRLGTWLHANGYRVHFGRFEDGKLQRKSEPEYEFVFIHPSCWKLYYLQVLVVTRSYVLVSGVKDCYIEYLEDQVPFHIKEPFRPSQLKRLEYLIKKEKGQLRADCIIVKSFWHYYKIPLDQIDLFERNKISNYTTIHTQTRQLVVFGILTAWERQLHCTGYFERVSDNLLIAKKHLDLVKSDFFMIKNQRFKIIRRFIDTWAYGKLKKSFPVKKLDMAK